MLKTITPAEMKRVESHVTRVCAITGELLMSRAAKAICNAALDLCGEKKGTVLCLCGTGNNGGDGLAALRMLLEANPKLLGECWLLDGSLSPDAARELDRLLSAFAQDEDSASRVRVTRLSGQAVPPLPDALLLIIDALFGTGLSRPLDGMAAALCTLANSAREQGLPVLAVDIPSGLNGETGETMGVSVLASHTVTFHRPKPGLFLRDGPDAAGSLLVSDIGIPPELDDADGFSILTASELRSFLAPRKRLSHKGTYGRVLLWVGQRGMAGAAAICASAALRAGAGLVTVACPNAIVDTVQTLCPCATCLPLPPNDIEASWALLSEALLRADAFAAGCGLGTAAATAELLDRLLRFFVRHPVAAVLDADALNMLSQRGAAEMGSSRLFLTPHPAEAARLLHCQTADITSKPVSAAQRLCQAYGASVVLKDAASVLVGADGRTALNPYGTPAMAKGGSGDALTGVLSAMLANRAAGGACIHADDAAVLQIACALHGLAGKQAGERFGERGALATDLCECLGIVNGDGML